MGDTASTSDIAKGIRRKLKQEKTKPTKKKKVTSIADLRKAWEERNKNGG